MSPISCWGPARPSPALPWRRIGITTARRAADCMGRRKSVDDSLGMTRPITRRDFINGVLAGCGAALMTHSAHATGAPSESLAPSGSPWTGYGGVGDYSSSNGNTQAVVDAAHRIRDR